MDVLAVVGEPDSDPSRERGAGLRSDDNHATVSLSDLMEADRHARLLRRLSER
jgi:hypothetical protein